MWLATLVEFLPPVTRAVAPSFHSMPIVPPPCIQEKVQNQGSGPPTDAKSQDVVLSDASSNCKLYPELLCYQGTGPILLKYVFVYSASFCPRYSPVPGHCTFPTDAKAKDEVLLASPIAAKSVTFITHIASCIQYVVHYQGTGLSADAKA